MNICVFCGSNANAGEPYVSSAINLGTEMGRRGHTLVFGGFETGLMSSVAHAAAKAGGSVLGVITTDIPYLSARPVFPCDTLLKAHNLSDRKDMMFEHSDAFVALPGSVGTLDEIFSALAEQKVKDGYAPKPTGIYNVQGYYDALGALFDQMLLAKFMDPKDRDLFRICDTAAATLNYVEQAVLCATN